MTSPYPLLPADRVATTREIFDTVEAKQKIARGIAGTLLFVAVAPIAALAACLAVCLSPMFLFVLAPFWLWDALVEKPEQRDAFGRWLFGDARAERHLREREQEAAQDLERAVAFRATSGERE